MGRVGEMCMCVYVCSRLLYVLDMHKNHLCSSLQPEERMLGTTGEEGQCFKALLLDCHTDLSSSVSAFLRAKTTVLNTLTHFYLRMLSWHFQAPSSVPRPCTLQQTCWNSCYHHFHID